ncbi:DUF1002 domain-containing protein [Methanobacterium alkalithermotolerans]|uniref:DUF1002 domain-containing protein n=1 Tax=Methanobacterium alkalithermotolerans TaxID=2731220 RepID=A0A8T8K3F0_9EURY|nr:DUF1002 domain-containing protein [Methanobacterium alkalithermotolerans]QUH23046.1 DUF1002 domain-containing protein [Methanobacterium alkalithermotolerans]RJS48643.1 MAG: hypothetical protein CIT03_07390 [Methanobacterium sp.]
MKKYLAGFLLILILVSPLYAESAEVIGFSVTLGEATNSNAEYKNAMLNYFQTKTDKNVSEIPVKVITASEVNDISQSITGRTYGPSQIFSCAMVDLSYSPDIKVDVDKSKVTVVTPQMYATALQSSGIDKGYVVVTSPVSASGEAALAGVLRSYEIAVGTPIPEEAKKVSTEELYLGTRLANETGESQDNIAELFSEVKNQTQKQDLEDPSQIKGIVENVSSELNINLSENQTQEVADSVANSQKVQGSLTEFKDQLNNISQQLSTPEPNQDILSQISSFLQWAFEYLQNLISGQ